MMTGALLKNEFVIPGRKLHTFLVRGGYCIVLAMAFGIVFLIYGLSAQGIGSGAALRVLRNSGQQLFSAIVSIDLLVCLLFTPAYVASAISDEKDRRTLQDLLLTTMSVPEIVLSKLLGRLAQVLLVLAAGVPLVAVCMLLGGVSGTMVLALLALVCLWLLVSGSLTMLISVLSRRTRDAILGSYACGALLLLGATVAHFVPPPILWLSRLVDAFYPFKLVAAASSGASPGMVWGMIAENALVLGAFSALCTIIAIAVLRRVCVRHLEVKPPRRVWRIHRRPRSLPHERPMLWKEQLFPPSGRVTLLLRLLGIPAAAFMCCLLAVRVWAWIIGDSSLHAALSPRPYLPLMAWPVYLSLLLSSSAAFAGEREKGTWDAILTSPLEDREIVWGKLVGSIWDVRWWLVAIAIGFICLAVEGLSQESLRGVSLFDCSTRILRALRGVVTGVFGGSMGIVGLIGEILFATGLGLRISIGSNSSGRALAKTLMIWIASGIVFSIVVYMSIALVAFGFLAAFARPSAGPVSVVAKLIADQLVWLGPLMIGCFWGLIGLWLTSETLRRFDALASRMGVRKVLRLEGLPAPGGGTASGSAPMAV